MSILSNSEFNVAMQSGQRHAVEDKELPRYDRTMSYDWNYDHAPDTIEVTVPPVAGQWRFCGLPVGSPLGIPAGPLLNSRWLLYYASLGFDVLVYKTVRSAYRACYPLPNLLPVGWNTMLTGAEGGLPAADEMRGSWAVSFGMPSKSPATWQADVERARKLLARDKILCVSVVGSVQPEWTIDQLADDYAICAKWAVESGADVVEVNFSCPNVSTCDGQLYLNFRSAEIVAARVRESIGKTPLVIKIGLITENEHVEQFLDAVAIHVDGLAMTNSIAATVAAASGDLLFEGAKRAICGTVTRAAAMNQIQMFSESLAVRRKSLCLVGVGGAASADDVRQFLQRGADAVHIATAAMIHPAIALEIRRQL